ncbi:5'-methylthioadenosine/adenosylhomocysteine nucleosidase [Mycoplasma sp. P36-A1]|uniref:5'-methylthioadenosine/adenosylhomocysteine nucleosidase n=1 Tax=Mycoplasma sp. P36-A1 TaxID=3252900 RepID=UPI003C2CA9AB
MILAVAAMQEEYQELEALMENPQEGEFNGVKYHQGRIEDKDVVLMLSGIGKVNASWSIVTILNELDIDFIINIGSAGGVVNNHHVKAMDIVVAKKVCQHDVDLTAADRPLGMLPNLPVYYESAVSDNMMKSLSETGLTYHYATIASGDTFVADTEKVTHITDNFEDVCAVEMEAGAIAQIAFLKKIPFVVFRSISDVIGDSDSNQIQFEQYIQLASKNSAKAAHTIIKAL